MQAGDYQFICSLVRDESGMVIESGKEYLAKARLEPIVREEGLGGLPELVARLRAERYNGLHRRVVAAMLIHETSFYRDRRPFDALKDEILPALIRSRARDRRLDIWCAACSSGQEPYSIAMLIKQHFPELDAWQVRILGTDLSEAVLDRARAGRYSQLEVNRGVPARELVKFFDRDGTRWLLKPAVREMVEYRRLNLCEPWPYLPKMDVIFMRNVLLYFSPETRKPVLAQTAEVLRPDGCLFLGGPETMVALGSDFERTEHERASCYQLAQR